MNKIAISFAAGLAALFAISLLNTGTGPLLPVNEITLGVSAVGGVPGVVLLLCSRFILG